LSKLIYPRFTASTQLRQSSGEKRRGPRKKSRAPGTLTKIKEYAEGHTLIFSKRRDNIPYESTMEKERDGGDQKEGAR